MRESIMDTATRLIFDLRNLVNPILYKTRIQWLQELVMEHRYSPPTCFGINSFDEFYSAMRVKNAKAAAEFYLNLLRKARHCGGCYNAVSSQRRSFQEQTARNMNEFLVEAGLTWVDIGMSDGELQELIQMGEVVIAD